MSWLIALAVAVAAFFVAAFAFKVERRLYTSLLATLALGLAGYAYQASPDIPAAPKGASAARVADFDIVEARRELISADEQSRANILVVADGMARQGQFADAADFLVGLTRENPRDFEAWLAQGNALVEHADGVLTPASLYAYRRAASLKPDHPAPGYFLGLSLIRQGQIMEARQVWTDTLAASPANAAGREVLAERIARLEEMLGIVAEGEGAEAAN